MTAAALQLPLSGMPPAPSEESRSVLGPIKSNLSPPAAPETAADVAKRKAEVRLRLRMRDASQKITRAKGVQACGRVPAGFGASATVSLRVRPSGRGFFHGLVRCANPWQCPVCVIWIQGRRCEELEALDAKHRDAGGAVLMATLTFPHDYGDALEPMRRHLARSWSRAISGAPWRRQRQALGIIGYVRAAEITNGPNGWHPHLHVVLYLHRAVTANALGAFEAWLYARWSKLITSGHAVRMPSEAHGVKVEACRDSSYLAKMGLAAELTLSGTKRGRPGHRTPMQILRDLTVTDDRHARQRDVALWREWCDGMQGARQLTWSRGVRDLAKWYQTPLTEPDEAPAVDPQLELPGTPSPVEARDAGPLDAIVYEFSREEWRAVVHHRRSVQLRLDLLEVAEARPPDEWADAVLRIIDRARGLAPVPF